ncbi:MAG TPA: MarR family transcriptional regulator [Acidimicrobiales bacterium]|nr:MarR family transcriptional regulator [Acidimicrobiales bacterium]
MAGHGERVVLTPVTGEGNLDLVDALAQLSFAVHGSLARIAAAHDLSMVQVRLLGILRDRRPTVSELARFLELDKSSVTGLVDRAAGRGLVRRVPAARDGRSVLVVITPAGRALVGRAVQAFDAAVAALAIDLSPTERHRLSVLASRVVVADARRRGIVLEGEPEGVGVEA